MRLVKRKQALLDMRDIYFYIAADSEQAADRFLVELEAAYERLLQMPRIGKPRAVENPRVPELRSWPIPGFEDIMVFDQPLEDSIEVMRILHGKRDLDPILRELI
ncbi:MAG: type II toxin-antitoxin system RelE/ParE family toxin [Candidatus Omnitrophica bacterium]|nr:type II toxin-antitoxin system RelE/ParE family toxin [Candidatus Omnitrophota bacterium]